MKTVSLHGKKAAGRVALVDDADYEMVGRYRWRVFEQKTRTGAYAITSVWRNGARITFTMHRLLLPHVPMIDHEDGDGLNNQRYNLREADGERNQANAGKTRTWRGQPVSSAYKGVHWNKQRQKWQASIHVNYGTQYLGLFADEQDAARAYDAAALAAWDEFARLNFPE